jgi:hypothetical protein
LQLLDQCFTLQVEKLAQARPFSLGVHLISMPFGVLVGKRSNRIRIQPERSSSDTTRPRAGRENVQQ